MHMDVTLNAVSLLVFSVYLHKDSKTSAVWMESSKPIECYKETSLVGGCNACSYDRVTTSGEELVEPYLIMSLALFTCVNKTGTAHNLDM